MISVITVNFNNYDGLVQTCESIWSQSVPSYEHIIIDGGSTDGSVDYIENYKRRFAHVSIGEDQGIFDAMNLGLKYAKGDWINFLNSGDTFENNFVVEYLTGLSSLQDSVGIIYGNTLVDGVIVRPKPLVNLKYGGLAGMGHQSIFYNRLICGSELLYPTQYKYLGDVELTRRLYLIGIQFHYIDYTIAHYEGGGFSSVSTWNSKKASIYYMTQHYGLLGVLFLILGKVKNRFNL